MRCSRCGNENPGNNRFCGMCGATLLSSSPPAPVHPAPQPVSAAAAPLSNPAPASQPAPEAPRVVTRVEQEPAPISGPSFLGLNDPAPPRKKGSLSIDPHSSTSSNLDYLLEDVEEPKGGGAGKVFLILLALLLAVGFGYLRFRTHGFPWASSGTSKPAPSAQTSGETEASTPPASSPSITPEPQPATSAAAQPAAPIQPASAPVANSPATPAQPAAQPAQPASSSPSTTGSANASPAPTNSASAAKASDTAPPAADANQPADNAASSGNGATAPDKDSSTAAPAAPAQPAADAPAPKPPAATRPIDTVAEAQRYLYGKGASQDCDRGLRLLKPSANQGNPKAMVEMGALYSAGLCTPRDLPTAYRWFALALRKDPSNDSIQADLQKLWGEMTQPERQLAIRLTQ